MFANFYKILGVIQTTLTPFYFIFLLSQGEISFVNYYLAYVVFCWSFGILGVWFLKHNQEFNKEMGFLVLVIMFIYPVLTLTFLGWKSAFNKTILITFFMITFAILYLVGQSQILYDGDEIPSEINGSNDS